jgi:membrane associated rhomboid family serine protease
VKKWIRGRKRGGIEAAQASAAIVFLLYGGWLLEIASQMRLALYGIYPRTLPGLMGIVFSPFLHYNLAHLTANASALFVLLFILFLDKNYRPEETLLFIWILSGIGTWLIGRPAIHIGASAVIYGLVAYLIASGYWSKNWRSAIVGALVLIFYGGIFYGMLPHKGFVSWEGHLSGAIAGLWVARLQHA